MIHKKRKIRRFLGAAVLAWSLFQPLMGVYVRAISAACARVAGLAWQGHAAVLLVVGGMMMGLMGGGCGREGRIVCAAGVVLG